MGGLVPRALDTRFRALPLVLGPGAGSLRSIRPRPLGVRLTTIPGITCNLRGHGSAPRWLVGGKPSRLHPLLVRAVVRLHTPFHPLIEVIVELCARPRGSLWSLPDRVDNRKRGVW